MTIARLMQMARAGVPAGDVWTDPDLANASYDGVSFSVAGQDATPTEVFFKSDGSKMYVVGDATDSVYQYSLSTAWDISTASYDSVSFGLSNELSITEGLFFSSDGDNMYAIGRGADIIFQYNLSTAWDISTASYSTKNFSVAGEENAPRGIYFKPDGTKFYITGSAGDDINEYSLSTAWDISSASYVQNFSVSAQDTSPQDLFFSPNGDAFYMTGASSDSVYEYTLSTAWDISTTSYSQAFNVSSQELTPRGLFFKSDGSKMYIVGSNSNTIYQYSTD